MIRKNLYQILIHKKRRLISAEAGMKCKQQEIKDNSK